MQAPASDSLGSDTADYVSADPGTSDTGIVAAAAAALAAAAADYVSNRQPGRSTQGPERCCPSADG